MPGLGWGYSHLPNKKVSSQTRNGGGTTLALPYLHMPSDGRLAPLCQFSAHDSRKMG